MLVYYTSWTVGEKKQAGSGNIHYCYCAQQKNNRRNHDLQWKQ